MGEYLGAANNANEFDDDNGYWKMSAKSWVLIVEKFHVSCNRGCGSLHSPFWRACKHAPHIVPSTMLCACCCTIEWAFDWPSADDRWLNKRVNKKKQLHCHQHTVNELLDRVKVLLGLSMEGSCAFYSRIEGVLITLFCNVVWNCGLLLILWLLTTLVCFRIYLWCRFTTCPMWLAVVRGWVTTCRPDALRTMEIIVYSWRATN